MATFGFAVLATAGWVGRVVGVAVGGAVVAADVVDVAVGAVGVAVGGAVVAAGVLVAVGSAVEVGSATWQPVANAPPAASPAARRKSRRDIFCL
jgi:hypothetical protein